MDEAWLDLFGNMILIEEIKQGMYRDMAARTSNRELKKLLESLYESKRRYSNQISHIRDELPEEDFIEMRTASIDSLSKKASWLLTNLERKKEIAPTIESKMLVIEFLQRTEEECFEFHKSLRDMLIGIIGKDFEKVIIEEKKEVENLRQLAVRILTGF